MEFILNPKIENLKYFFNKNKKNTKYFRYFKKRSFDIIDNHILTLLLIDGDKTVGYGHLDLEDGITWLGIMVCDDCKSKGYGKIIMDKLITYRNNDIYLSVDNENIIAQKLYAQSGFVTIENNVNNKIMILKKNG